MRNDLKLGLAIGGLAFFLLFLVLYLAFTQPKAAPAGGGAVAASTGYGTTPPAKSAVGKPDGSQENRMNGPIVIPDVPTQDNTAGNSSASKADGGLTLTPLIGSQTTPPTGTTGSAGTTPAKGSAADNERQGDNGWLARYSRAGNPQPEVSTTPAPSGTPRPRTFDNPDGAEAMPAGGTAGVSENIKPDAGLASVPNQYTVKPNDTLSSIAKQALGSPNRWEALYNLNRDKIGDDPGALKVGTVLRLK